ncbi:cobalt transporter CbiM [Campylobacter porcelli]|uniref:Co/Ni ABC transporter CbiKLMQO, membrane protein CbiM n=1 Tax=Campylobacter porcelli TaxID=1660073 RepID=A0A1X9SUW9_9BACT|nr:cobalt transporter CbiM [Campylobacter sp. RM6137]ARQ99975.1 Co/Ni ABC transporter CbiKLMQO, membrane protein CbiM [Campylobacter sp. RM6137]
MHISEGVLKPEIIIPSSVVAGVLVVYLLYRLNYKDIPKIACMSAIFFIASFIHVPLGPTSIHLILGGLVGAFLGVNALLAIFAGLLLQALFFGYGGISVLGVNLLMLALPSILGRYFVKLSLKECKYQKIYQPICWFLVGFISLLGSALILSGVLVLNGKEFYAIASVALASNLVLMMVEGIISLFAIGFIYKVNRGLLN